MAETVVFTREVFESASIESKDAYYRCKSSYHSAVLE